ncbi:hypothetical protein K1719_019389 [Acacia pycnantha]|nr:hypothetical protein K1719_019389 [Acacia pycnantha]
MPRGKQRQLRGKLPRGNIPVVRKREWDIGGVLGCEARIVAGRSWIVLFQAARVSSFFRKKKATQTKNLKINKGFWRKRMHFRVAVFFSDFPRKRSSLSFLSLDPHTSLILKAYRIDTNQ